MLHEMVISGSCSAWQGMAPNEHSFALANVVHMVHHRVVISTHEELSHGTPSLAFAA